MGRDQASFDAFVAANAAALLRTGRFITLDDGEAEDLVQECLLTVSQRWRRVGDMDQPLSYARRVLVNLAVRGSRQRSRRHVELGGELTGAGAQLDAGDVLLAERDELFWALRQLSSRQRAVLVLRYFHDLSADQTAEILGGSASTVRSTTSRSLAQLRDLLDSRTAWTGAARDE